jgi:hypothetical protein
VSARARLFLVVAIVAAGIVGYRWWNSPERQIRRVLDAIVERVSHDAPISGLAAVAAANSIQEHFALDTAVEPGEPSRRLVGRGEVASAAARLLMATPTLHLSLEDVETAIGSDETSASVTCRMTAIFQDRAGQATLDLREVTIGMRLAEGRWVIERASARRVEPEL